jgi:phosphohistidine phosphatase SixA
MVVGHNPNLSEFLGRLISGGSAEAYIDLKKGAVAKVEVGRRNGELHWCVTPKILRTLYESFGAGKKK